MSARNIVGQGSDPLESKFDKKLDRALFKTEVAHLKSQILEAKNMALRAEQLAQRPHNCAKRGEINGIKKTLESLKTLKVGGIISLLILVVSGVAQYYAFRNTVDNNSIALSKVSASLEGMRKDQSVVNAKLLELEFKNDAKKTTDVLLLKFLQANTPKEGVSSR